MSENQYILNNGNLIFTFGFNAILEELKEKYKDYEDKFIKIKHVYSNIDGIIRFEFLIVDDEVKDIIRDVESKPSHKVQKEIYEVYVADFQKTLLEYFTSKLEILKKELEGDDEVKYLIFPSHVTMFQYLRSSSTLRLEILL